MDKYGLIGYPLGHSFSIGFFNEKFQNEGIDAQYCNFEIPSLDCLPEIIAQIFLMNSVLKPRTLERSMLLG